MQYYTKTTLPTPTHLPIAQYKIKAINFLDDPMCTEVSYYEVINPKNEYAISILKLCADNNLLFSFSAFDARLIMMLASLCNHLPEFYHLEGIDFQNANNPILQLHSGKYDGMQRVPLNELKLGSDLLKQIDSQSCYRIGYLQGLNTIGPQR